MFWQLFSASDRKVEGFLKSTDCLWILSYVLKRFILCIRPDLFSSAILSDMFKQSLAMLSGGDFQGESKIWKCSLLFVNLEIIYQVHFSMQHSVNVCLNLNTSYKNVYAFSQSSLYPSGYNAWVSKLLRDVAFTWRPRELSCKFKKWRISGNFAI